MNTTAPNLFYEKFGAIEERQLLLINTLDRMREALPKNGEVMAAISNLGSSIDMLRTGIMQTGTAQVQQNARIADTLAFRIRPEAGAPIAYLCLGVDTDGTFNRASHIGRFLISVCNGGDIGDRGLSNDQIGLQQLSPSPTTRAGKGKVRRDVFVGRATKTAPEFDIPTSISADDYGRFYDIAPSLLALITVSK